MISVRNHNKLKVVGMTNYGVEGVSSSAYTKTQTKSAIVQTCDDKSPIHNVSSMVSHRICGEILCKQWRQKSPHIFLVLCLFSVRIIVVSEKVESFSHKQRFSRFFCSVVNLLLERCFCQRLMWTVFIVRYFLFVNIYITS